MDIFSHALLPYLLGKSFKRNREEVTAFVLGGIAPDADIFIMWINLVYPTFFLITHRGITHSLFFGFITAIGFLYLVSWQGIKSFLRRFIDFEPVVTGRSVAFACAGVALHLFLDFLTTRGAPLFYPLSTMRYSAELFFYTDFFMTVLSLVMIVYLYKNPLQRNTAVKFLLIFLITFVLLGSVRSVEKTGAYEYYGSAGMKVYPTENPFKWYVTEGTAEETKIYEYNELENRSMYNETIKNIFISSPGEGLDAAIEAAEGLSQVRMFRWRAFTVAVNASYDNGAWQLEYYDPVARAHTRDIPGIFKGLAKGFSSINVIVKEGKAAVQ